MLIYSITSVSFSILRIILRFIPENKLSEQKRIKLEWFSIIISFIFLIISILLTIDSYTNLNIIFLIINASIFFICSLNLFKNNIVNIILISISFLLLISIIFFVNYIITEKKLAEELAEKQAEEKEKLEELEYLENLKWDDEFIETDRKSHKLVFLANKEITKKELHGSFNETTYSTNAELEAFIKTFDIYHFFYYLDDNETIDQKRINIENIEIEFSETKEPSYDIVTKTMYLKNYNVDPVEITYKSKSYSVKVLVISKEDFKSGMYLDFLKEKTDEQKDLNEETETITE